MLRAQDVHFSRYLTTPLLVNPATTGMSDGAPRVAVNYRNQWSKLGIPFKTTYGSVDGSLTAFENQISLGGAFVHDQASAYILTADEVMFSVSYSRIINNNQFSIGIQPGMVFKSLNYESLTFSSQFDGSRTAFDPTIPSGEVLSGNLHHFDLGAGIFWRTLIHNVMPSAGISVRHLNRPMESFASGIADSRLPRKLTLHAQVEIPVGSKIVLTPSMLFGYNSGSTEWLAGSVLGYHILRPSIPIREIQGMAMIRVNPWRNADAIILGAGVQLRFFELGFAYDVNISPLAKSTSLRGSYEVSLVYRGTSKNMNRTHEPCRIF
jgi:type IX secretion system PorP/SprF family membrane protein